MKYPRYLPLLPLHFRVWLLPVKQSLLITLEDWQTFETENFRVHFTPEYRQWALSSAREMEVVRQLIKEQQGRVLTEKVDTFIIDPYNAANGFAVPLSHKPYMALFATPAQSDTVISKLNGLATTVSTT